MTTQPHPEKPPTPSADGEAPNEILEPGSHVAPATYYIKVVDDGPLLIYGSPKFAQVFIGTSYGVSTNYVETKQYTLTEGTALCRCGASKNKPYCDGSHPAKMDMKETAPIGSTDATLQAFPGPVLTLTDNEVFCCFARFCDAGERVWNEVKLAGTEATDLTMKIAQNCPGGRLIVWDTITKQPIEPPEVPFLGLIEDPSLGVSGPLMVRGGIPVSNSSGEVYEVRNRQGLCRCGHSSNKPFCDGTHAKVKFVDGLF